MSPLHIITNSLSSKSVRFYRDSFYKSFSPIIYSNTQSNILKIKESEFKYSLQSTILLQSLDCYSFANIPYHANKTIKNIVIRPEDFWVEYKDRRPYSSCSSDSEFYGNITIISSVFDKCNTETNGGGGLSIQQFCSVFLYELLFNECYSFREGGAILAMGYLENGVFGKPLYNLKIQYCCFQNCKGERNGTAIYAVSNDSFIRYMTSYATTLQFPNGWTITPWGGQFDINSKNVNFNSINLTKGKSYHTVGIDLRDCLNEVDGSTEGKFSMIYLIRCNASFEKVSFMNTKYANKNWKIAIFDGEDLFILFSNCIFDDSQAKLPLQANDIDCEFESSFTQNIDHLKYKSCAGQITPEYLILTSIFTKSAYFTFSDYFPSKGFTMSVHFTESVHFSDSFEFTLSNQFSSSLYFLNCSLLSDV